MDEKIKALQEERDNHLQRAAQIGRELKHLEALKIKQEYGDKYGCEFCRYGAVQGLSGDGWHNTCGSGNCTCCHDECDNFKPDNTLTLFIRKNINIGKAFLRSTHTNGHGHISEDACRALDTLGIHILYDDPHPAVIEKAIKVLCALFDVQEVKG